MIFLRPDNLTVFYCFKTDLKIDIQISYDNQPGHIWLIKLLLTYQAGEEHEAGWQRWQIGRRGRHNHQRPEVSRPSLWTKLITSFVAVGTIFCCLILLVGNSNLYVLPPDNSSPRKFPPGHALGRVAISIQSVCQVGEGRQSARHSESYLGARGFSKPSIHFESAAHGQGEGFRPTPTLKLFSPHPMLNACSSSLGSGDVSVKGRQLYLPATRGRLLRILYITAQL